MDEFCLLGGGALNDRKGDDKKNKKEERTAYLSLGFALSLSLYVEVSSMKEDK